MLDKSLDRMDIFLHSAFVVLPTAAYAYFFGSPGDFFLASGLSGLVLLREICQKPDWPRIFLRRQPFLEWFVPLILGIITAGVI